LDLQNRSLMAPGRVYPLEVTSVTSVACSSAPGQVLAACSVILLFWLPLLQPAAPPVALLLLLVLLLLLGSSHPRRFACSWPAQPLVPLLGSLLRSLLQWAAPQKVFLVAAAAQSPPGPPGGWGRLLLLFLLRLRPSLPSPAPSVHSAWPAQL
jgi:hypothetical protein